MPRSSCVKLSIHTYLCNHHRLPRCSTGRNVTILHIPSIDRNSSHPHIGLYASLTVHDSPHEVDILRLTPGNPRGLWLYQKIVGTTSRAASSRILSATHVATMEGSSQGESHEKTIASELARYRPRQTQRYAAVNVLLLSWEDDDIGCAAEIAELHLLFQQSFNYAV
jgi:hypothetical protein